MEIRFNKDDRQMFVGAITQLTERKLSEVAALNEEIRKLKLTEKQWEARYRTFLTIMTQEYSDKQYKPLYESFKARWADICKSNGWDF